MKELARTKTVGRPGEPQVIVPNETTPRTTGVLSMVYWMMGPPESPMHGEQRPLESPAQIWKRELVGALEVAQARSQAPLLTAGMSTWRRIGVPGMKGSVRP